MAAHRLNLVDKRLEDFLQLISILSVTFGIINRHNQSVLYIKLVVNTVVFLLICERAGNQSGIRRKKLNSIGQRRVRYKRFYSARSAPF